MGRSRCPERTRERTGLLTCFVERRRFHATPIATSCSLANAPHARDVIDFCARRVRRGARARHRAHRAADVPRVRASPDALGRDPRRPRRGDESPPRGQHRCVWVEFLIPLVRFAPDVAHLHPHAPETRAARPPRTRGMTITRRWAMPLPRWRWATHISTRDFRPHGDARHVSGVFVFVRSSRGFVCFVFFRSRAPPTATSTSQTHVVVLFPPFSNTRTPSRQHRADTKPNTKNTQSTRKRTRNECSALWRWRPSPRGMFFRIH